MALRLTKLNPDLPVHAFTCGTKPGAPEIDDYLRTRAQQEQDAGLSVVWVLVDDEVEGPDGVIVGFFTLSPMTVRVNPVVTEAIGLPQLSYPTIGGYLLGRLGVNVMHQGGTIGRDLVAAGRDKALDLRSTGGGVFLAVDPKNDTLSAWYNALRFGFQRLEPANAQMRRIFLTL